MNANILLGVHQLKPKGRALFIRPIDRSDELVDYMLPGSTVHKLTETTAPELLLGMVDQQLQTGEFTRV